MLGSEKGCNLSIIQQRPDSSIRSNNCPQEILVNEFPENQRNKSIKQSDDRCVTSNGVRIIKRLRYDETTIPKCTQERGFGHRSQIPQPSPPSSNKKEL